MVAAPGRITLWGIEVFLAIAEEGSVSAAAQRLGVSVSSISQQLTNLEQAIGSRLVERSARPLVLTPAGVMFRKRARSILNEAEQAQAELATADFTQLTQFRLGMIEDLETDVTPLLLSEMSEELAQSKFLLETGPSHRLFDQLDSRALDVIVAAESGNAADWMEIHPLLREPYIVAVPKGYGATAERLAALPLIQYTGRHVMGRQISDHLARQNIQLMHRFELDSYHAIMALVAREAGWTILTVLGVMRAQRFLADVDLHPMPFAPMSRELSLIARRDLLGKVPSDVARALRTLLTHHIVTPARERMPWLKDSLDVVKG